MEGQIHNENDIIDLILYKHNILMLGQYDRFISSDDINYIEFAEGLHLNVELILRGCRERYDNSTEYLEERHFITENVITINGYYDLRPNSYVYGLNYTFIYGKLKQMNKDRLATYLINRPDNTEINLSDDTNALILRVENEILNSREPQEFASDKFYAVVSYIRRLISIFDEYKSMLNFGMIERIIFSENFGIEYINELRDPHGLHGVVDAFDTLYNYFTQEVNIIF